MAESDHQAKFTSGNLMRHVAVMSFTGSIGLMAIFVVSFIDLIFISMLGNSALAAAVGFAGTLLFIGNSASIGVSIAAGVLVARALGADDKTRAQRAATNVMIIGSLASLALTALMIVFMNPMLDLVGAQGETKVLARTYLWVLLTGTVLMTIAMIGNAILRAYGDASRAMYATLFGGIANAIFDPIFIFVFDWGLAGAAWASMVSRVVILYFSVRPLFRQYEGFSAPNLASLKGEAREISSLAIPAVLANVASPVGSGIVTRAMSSFGDDAVAAIAVIGRLTPVAFSVVFALSGAVGPIIGQNAGAANYDRVRHTYRDAIIFSAVYVAVVSAILFFARGLIADIFNAEGEVRDLIYLFCGPVAPLYFFTAVIYVSNACFNNLEHPIYSTSVNWGRNTIVMLPCVYLGAQYWGAAGVLVGSTLSAVVVAIMAYFLTQRLIAQQTGVCKKMPFRELTDRHVIAQHRR